jgi:cell division protein FtsB
MQYSREKRHSASFLNKLKRKLKVEFFLSLALAFLVIYSLYIFFGSENNIYNYVKKIYMKKNLISEIENLKKENLALKEKIEFLKKDNFYIEKRAREDLGLKKDNEEIYVIIDKNLPEEKNHGFINKSKKWLTEIIKTYKSYNINE